MTLTVLSVAFALAPVGPDAVGGSEQILHALDQGLTARGHRSLVVACRGSSAAGTLIDTLVDPMVPVCPDVRRAAEAATREAVARVLAAERVDLIHMHGLDFPATLPPPGPPALVTLHLPSNWYGALTADRPDTWLHCVSQAQHNACPQLANLLPPITNGVPVTQLGGLVPRRRFAVMLGRICPEKGQQIALEAAHRAGMKLMLGGIVFPYPDHLAYWDQKVAPLLDQDRRFVGPVAFAAKRRLLSSAQCVLVPSLAAETSSLIAMEAFACGAPVIAFRAGALGDIVEHGRTGFLVENAEEMAEAMAQAHTIDPETCRATARARFDLPQMVKAYLARYDALVSRQAGRRRAAA